MVAAMLQAQRTPVSATVPNDLEPYWMPFTANRAFKKRPRLIVGAKDMHYIASDGRKLIDGAAGLWCTNAGHNREPIVAAIQREAATLDYAPAFQFGHAKAFELASRIAALAPGDLDHVFFCNSGSEAVDTALKIALAYHNVRGNASRVRLIGRERGYHGVGFGGISVGGISANRKVFGSLLTGVDHLPHTHLPAKNAFSRGEPEHGGDLAEDLERIVALHDASTIAAVIIEPVAGSTGVLIPPKGYLKRIREICDKHGILLIFDEVITGFRVSYGGAQALYGTVPDLTCLGKIIGGGLPVGAYGGRADLMALVAPAGPVYQAGTLSGNPLAMAAGLWALAELSPRLYTHLAKLGAHLAAGLADAARAEDRWSEPYPGVRYLERTGGVQTQAAEVLKMSFRSFRYYAKKLGITSEDGAD